MGFFLQKRTLYINKDMLNKDRLNKDIYCFWTGTNEMSKQRTDCLDQLRKVSECNVILVTPENLNTYILKDHPLHDGYQYLSETHKSDYLRTYFMRFYGGGYSDIKKTTRSWISSFNKLYNSTKWIIGYMELSDGVANRELVYYWKELIGNCAYICKPNTLLVVEWYDKMIKLMDEKYQKLKENPSKFPQDCHENGTGYPIEWNELLGRIFHRILYKYKDNVINTLPIPIFTNYR